jgi:uncharacterized protein YdhG (YjbR/CyaY superfamily)
VVADPMAVQVDSWFGGGGPETEGDNDVAGRSAFGTIDEYVAAFPPDVRAILEKIRVMIRESVPEAEEKISYNMPAFALDGDLIYFAAFKKHIGIFPPVRGDKKLAKELSPYRGDKGNLKFPSTSRFLTT